MHSYNNCNSKGYWLENTYFQKKMQGESVCTGSFFLTKLHESNSRGFAQQEKRETDHNL